MQQNVENGIHMLKQKIKQFLKNAKKTCNPTYQKIRELYFVNQFNPTAKGLNKKR